MDMSSIFGKEFTVSTWGESHGKQLVLSLMVVLQGASLCRGYSKVFGSTSARSNAMVTPRQEADRVDILPGVLMENHRNNSISLIIFNEDQRSHDYSDMTQWYRPGHADLTYDLKYGFRDYRGGGRSLLVRRLLEWRLGLLLEKF